MQNLEALGDFVQVDTITGSTLADVLAVDGLSSRNLLHLVHRIDISRGVCILRTLSNPYGYIIVWSMVKVIKFEIFTVLP